MRKRAKLSERYPEYCEIKHTGDVKKILSFPYLCIRKMLVDDNSVDGRIGIEGKLWVQ